MKTPIIETECSKFVNTYITIDFVSCLWYTEYSKVIVFYRFRG